jgi:hypothetical protein
MLALSINSLSAALALSGLVSPTAGAAPPSADTETDSSTIGPFVVAPQVYSEMQSKHSASETSNDDGLTAAGSVGSEGVRIEEVGRAYTANYLGADNVFEVMKAMEEQRRTTPKVVTVIPTPTTLTQGQEAGGVPRTDGNERNGKPNLGEQYKDDLRGNYKPRHQSGNLKFLSLSRSRNERARVCKAALPRNLLARG